MAKSQQHRNHQRQGGHNNNNRPKFNNSNKGNNNNHSNNSKSFKQQKHRVDKPKEVPINHSIKGPLFDKSKLTPVWKINRKIGPGLINGQNTCFLNSVVECLTYTPPLAQYLLQEEHKKSCEYINELNSIKDPGYLCDIL